MINSFTKYKVFAMYEDKPDIEVDTYYNNINDARCCIDILPLLDEDAIGGKIFEVAFTQIEIVMINSND